MSIRHIGLYICTETIKHMAIMRNERMPIVCAFDDDR